MRKTQRRAGGRGRTEVRMDTEMKRNKTDGGGPGGWGRRQKSSPHGGACDERKALSSHHDRLPHPQGLSAGLAAELLLRDGPNALRPPRGTPEYVKFARQLAGGLQCLMWVAAAICLIAFGIQASEGDLTTDDNVSGRCCGLIWDTGTWRREDIGHGLRMQGTQDGDMEM